MKLRRWIAVLTACVTVGLCGAFAGCSEEIAEGEVTVYMPDGAPALSMAKLMAEDTETDGVTYRVVGGSVDIALKVTNRDKEKNADFCILPVATASTQVDKDEYKLVGLVTQGNMYLVSNKHTEKIENLAALQGKTVGVVKINNVPGLTMKAALNRQEVAWQEVKEGVLPSDSLVNLQGVAGVDGSFEYYLVPEPNVSKLTASGKFHLVGDLQSLYNGDSGEVGYPQAVLVAKTELLETRREWAEGFIEKIAAAEDWLYTASGEEIFKAVQSHYEDKGVTPAFAAENLSAETIARCGISFEYAKNARGKIDGFLQELVEIDSSKASLISQSFYWQ
ncbi:MAG: ABC transporter substrate-binding protein [Clostridia bacterium]|nr:ABC transporter substrate-binding protein [Clostridia bacterium]